MSRPRATVTARDFGRVAVLHGGTSAERDISLVSGRAVLAALERRRVEAAGVDPAAGLGELIGGGFDRAWIALHGRGGEDGTIQGALEMLGIPYTGTGVMGSAIAMDKLVSKQLFTVNEVPTPVFVRVDRDTDTDALVDALGLPLGIKPAREGSSVGMRRVTRPEELRPAIETALGHDDCVIAERWIEGEEYTAAILGDEVLPLIRITTPREFYDYEAKYLADSTGYHCPCGLGDTEEAALRRMARRAFEAVGASGWGRVDFMVDERGRAGVLEVNTVPGMTDHSLVPMAASAAGIDFDELVWRILETSVGRATVRGGGEARVAQKG